ncbi:MAG: DUF6058 family natural product biosynthesis protein [Thermoplasmata archaeon]|nr:DUF6058 family natural product biosynthesis protein [Thermoplasmata archaeon]
MGHSAPRPVGPPPTKFSSRDARYVRSEFVTLADLASTAKVALADLRRAQARGEFPQPTYVTSDREGWYPPMLAVPLRTARRRRTDLRSLFQAEFEGALRDLRLRNPRLFAVVADQGGVGRTSDERIAGAYWAGLASGEFGACLRVPWVPDMIRKERLLASITGLTAEPRPAEARWRGALRRAVDELDRIEMSFAEWDRVRFGTPVSRDTHVDGPRKRFPAVFRETTKRG